MTIQEAISKAIEGGWVPQVYFFDGKAFSWKVQAVMKIKFKQRIWLDPLFWKALAKAMGWKYDPKEYASYQMHRMIDSLAEGKSIEDFFATL